MHYAPHSPLPRRPACLPACLPARPCTKRPTENLSNPGVEAGDSTRARMVWQGGPVGIRLRCVLSLSLLPGFASLCLSPSLSVARAPGPLFLYMVRDGDFSNSVFPSFALFPRSLLTSALAARPSPAPPAEPAPPGCGRWHRCFRCLRGYAFRARFTRSLPPWDAAPEPASEAVPEAAAEAASEVAGSLWPFRDVLEVR